MDGVKDRIKLFVKQIGITVQDFEKSIFVSNGYVNSISKSIGIDKIELIIEKYPNLNIEWVLIGKGEMVKGETEKEKYGVDITPLLDRIEKLSAENALLKKENEELKESNKKTGRSTDVPFSMVAEPEIGYKEKTEKR